MADDFSGHGENEEVFPDAPKLRKASQEGIAQDMLETNMPVLQDTATRVEVYKPEPTIRRNPMGGFQILPWDDSEPQEGLEGTAWGRDVGDLCTKDQRREAWEKILNDPSMEEVRRKGIAHRMGLVPELWDKEEPLYCLRYPGPEEDNVMWWPEMKGSREEYEALMWYAELRNEEDPGVRVALSREIGKIRRKYGPAVIETPGTNITEDHCLWKTRLAKQLEEELTTDTERLLMETPPGEPFIEEYGKMGIAYIEKLGKYTSCAYDIEGGPCASCGWQGRNDAEDYMRVAGRLANPFGSGGPEGATIAQEEPRLM